ncbi:DUF6182 family protein [Nocardia asteroides]|uniref:DUF6182 family protein n=1 Tax=Nocardia asteroides TaxID=1824 RepID=UPI0033F033F4
MFSQNFLQREIDSRIEQFGGRNGRRDDQGAAAVVVGAFDPVVFIRSSLDFALGLPDEELSDWCASFTRTIFLAGNPANLESRHEPRCKSSDNTIAWYAPTATKSVLAVRRLLKPLQGPSGVPPVGFSTRIEARGADSPQVAEVLVEVTGLSAEHYLVHVNHLIAESVAVKLISKSTVLHLRHVDRITPAEGPFGYLRVAPGRDGLLRCYSALVVRGQSAVFSSSE